MITDTTGAAGFQAAHSAPRYLVRADFPITDRNVVQFPNRHARQAARIEEFLAGVVPERGHVVICHKGQKGGMTTRFFPRDQIADAAGLLRWAARNQRDAYFAVASFETAVEDGTTAQGQPKYTGKRKQENVQYLCAFWYDLDIKREGDNKAPDRVYADEAEAFKWLRFFCGMTGLPWPNRIVRSGYGLHLYWVFKDALSRDQWQPYAEAMKATLVAHGARGDVGLTTDAARILRPPGTLNSKVPDDPRPVEVIETCAKIPNELIYEPLKPFMGVTTPRAGSNYSSSSNVIPFAGTKPALAYGHQSTLNAAAQAGVEQGWFNRLSTESKNELLREIAEHKNVKALADAGNREWLDYLFAFADAEYRGATEAREIALAWCQTSSKFKNEGDFDKDWDSFEPDRPNGITIATLLGAAREAGFDTQPYRDLANGVTTIVSRAPDLPTIRVVNGLRHKASDEGLAAMRAAEVPFYQRGRDLVRICRIPAKTSDGKDIEVSGIVSVAQPLLERELGKSARWEKCNAKGEWLRIDPPQDVAKQIAAMSGEWEFPSLTGVTGTPTLRPDGSVLDALGYDPATGLYLFAPPPMQQIPLKPSKADALAALALVDRLLDEFPFVDDASRSVGISMLLTPVLRGAFPVVPLHGVDAPQSGTGKSYLADISSAIATGERSAVIAAAPKQEETEKRLIMAALSGQAIIALDNINGEIGGDFLCQVTERPLMKVRRLCSSDDHLVRNAFTVFSNGNNMTVVADLVRRTLVGRLDANMERPYDRTFKADPLAVVLADRGRYVAAVLTIARAYIAAGKPGLLPALASFKEWSDLVRSAIVWLGRADPVSTIAVTAAADPAQQQCASVFSAWAVELPLAPAQYLTSELIEKSDEKIPNSYPIKYARPTLRDALGDIAGGYAGFGIDGKRLGKWLGRNEGVVCAGYKLAVDRSDKARPRWRLARV